VRWCLIPDDWNIVIIRNLHKLLLISTLTSLLAALPATASWASPKNTPQYLLKAEKVHFCEENVPNGWHVDGPVYFGGLGWLAATWDRYKLPGFPATAAQATPLEQARAMARFVAIVERGWWPDQLNGDQCTGGY
jgi:hypothetical protein